MVKVEYYPNRDVTVVTITGGNVEVVFDKPQLSVKDETPDGKPLIVLAA
jgi:hypothetical protein